VATGIKTIDTTEDDAITWLFSSPFDRSEGLRQKTIAVLGSDALLEKVFQLSKSGYNIVRFNDHQEDVIDAVVTDESSQQHDYNNTKIIWTEQNDGPDSYKESSILVSGKDIVEQALRVRQS